MFLSIDAGNSNIVFGLYDPTKKEWAREYRLITKKDWNPSEIEKNYRLFMLENNLKKTDVTNVGISSVVPELNTVLLSFCYKFFGKQAYLIRGKSYLKLDVSTKNPDEIGTDLMANITAAFYKHRQACIVVDFGTALTFSVVDPTGKVVGVNIVPGLQTAIKSLFQSTAKLPDVKLELPESVIGKNTIHSIQAGVLYGYTELVKGMLGSIQKELGYTCKVVATGGLSSILKNLEATFDEKDPNLTLTGIRLITEANSPDWI